MGWFWISHQKEQDFYSLMILFIYSICNMFYLLESGYSQYAEFI